MLRQMVRLSSRTISFSHEHIGPWIGWFYRVLFSMTHHYRDRHARIKQVGLSLSLLFLTACRSVELPTATEVSGLFGHGDICSLPSVTTSTNFFLLVAAGLLAGFSHCIGMCGPLVTTLLIRPQSSHRYTSTPLLSYHIGRLTTYVVLGAIMGMVGSVVRVNVVGSGWQGNLSIVIGGLMLLTGLSLWGVLPWLRYLEGAWFARRVLGWMRRLFGSRHPVAPLAMGLMNGLLPCGAVYALAFVAATSGDPVRGAMIMLAFGLGTLPAMVGVSWLVSRLAPGLRSNLYRFAAALVMLVGVQLTLRGLAVTGIVPHITLVGVSLW